jgi:hypothetical protein
VGGTRMSLSLATAITIAFAILLFLVRNRIAPAGDHASDETIRRNPPSASYALPPAELATRIFSTRDRDFIQFTRSSRLRHLYLAERKKVASHWVQQISHDASWIMREHRLRSRQSPNLSVGAETKLFWQYFELKLFCASLLLFIQIFGPHALVELASQVGALYQRIGQSLPDVPAASAIESARNLAA